DQFAEERLAGVLLVVGLGRFPGQGAQFHRDERQALALDAGDDLTDEATADAVGLDKYESALGHGQFASEIRIVQAREYYPARGTVTALPGEAPRPGRAGWPRRRAARTEPTAVRTASTAAVRSHRR